MPLYTDVVVTLKVTLSVPEDTIYDNESYFKELRHAIDESEWLTESGAECFEEVDSIKVELVDLDACPHPVYHDGHCAEMTCHNYVNKHRRL